METADKRLESLDLLRGFDLFCLLMLQPVTVTWLEIENNPACDSVRKQFTHVAWQGVGFWDLIMPLFLFMSGVAIPFALAKYKRGEQAGRRFYFRLFKRFCVLFVLGWIVQGNLLAWDAKQFHIFANTLQSIAVGYAVASVVYIRCSFRTQVAVAALCFATYLAIFATAGKMNYAPGTNIAEEIDRYVLGRFRDGVIWTDAHRWQFDASYHYTWILSSLNFVVTVMLGSFAGQILRLPVADSRRLKRLAVTGVVLLAAAWLMDPFFPIIKRIWSSSMTLFYGGASFLLMGLFYYVADMKGRTGGIKWLRYYGMNSIAAYCLFEVVDFRSVSDSLFFGLKPWVGVYYPLLGACFQSFIVLLIVKWMYDQRIFLKA